MSTVIGLLVAFACVAIVAVAVGVAVACWDDHTPTWTPRILRGGVVAVGLICLLLAALPTIAQVLP